MSGPVDVLAVLDEYASLVGDDHAVNVCNCDITAARAAVAELVDADREYDAALAALQEHYRIVAERGYLAARLTDARTLSDRVVRAELRRETALARFGGAP